MAEEKQDGEHPSLENAVPDDVSPPRGCPFPIVGVGASAGGLEAFMQFLRALPADTGMAFVFIQHLDPHYPSELRSIFATGTNMPVRTIEDAMPVEQNAVYVIPPNTSIALERGTLKVRPREQAPYLPIDTFFQSLAREQGSRSIGIILSGNASDGSQGVLAIKAECGVTFAQDEASSRFTGMPRNAAATGAIDFVLGPREIAEQVARLGRHPYVVPPRQQGSKSPEAPIEILPGGDGDLKKLLTLLQSGTGVDFTHYKRTTVRRRIGRRMIVHRMETLREYVDYVRKRPGELRELYRDLLIIVTNFFRDPETFATMRELLAHRISADRADPVRVWVPGCATGEEVYSLAITIYELLQDRGRSLPMQLFGTDISDFALSRARDGIYSPAIVQDVSPERLERFFVKIDTGYQISKHIRESCIFARQDLTRDPPFSHLDIVSCRNVLIYLDVVLQKKIIPIFHYSLKRDGMLLLGSAEATAGFDDLFKPAEGASKIFVRSSEPARFTMDLDYSPAPTDQHDPPVRPPHLLPSNALLRNIDRIVQQKYAPGAVVVSSEYNIVEFRGDTSPYLAPSPGQASLNLLRMARENLIVPLRSAFHTALEGDATVIERAFLTDGGETREINVEVTPIVGPGAVERHYLVVFEGPEPGRAGASIPPMPASDSEKLAHQLQQELSDARDQLRNLGEDHSAHLEELQAANEEIRSANEELQSTNEELSTTKEELQSSNEELTTVNEELRNRNRELSSLNDDLKNLLAAVNVPILIIDNDLRVRRFTEPSEALLDLGPLDMGRKLSHIHGPFPPNSITTVVQTALETLAVEQVEIQDHNGTWYSINARPYRTTENRIEGALLSFVNIDPMKRGLQAAQQSRDYAEALIETVREPLVVLDADLRVRRVTSAFYEMFQVSAEETVGRNLYDLGNGQWNVPRLRELLGDALFRNSPFQDFEMEHEFPHIGRRSVRLNGRRIPLSDGEPRLVLMAIEDVSERMEVSEIRYRRLFEAAKDGILVADANTSVITDVNAFFLELTGFAREQFIGKELLNTPAFNETPDIEELLDETRRHSVARREDMTLHANRKRDLSVEIVANRYVVGSQEVMQLNIRDISDRRLAEGALRESEERFRLFADSVQDYALFLMDLNGRVMSWNSGAERVLGYKESEIIGRSSALLFTLEDVEAGEMTKELITARRDGRAEDERWHIRKDGTRFWGSGVVTVVRDDAGRLRGFAKIMRNQTERKRAHEQLQTALREKELLLREIHHRVKNNLQVITSLLNLQASGIDDADARRPLEEMRDRVRAIGRIHDQLNRSQTLSEIDMSDYVEHLAKDLRNIYGFDPDRIRITTDMCRTRLTIDQTMPCGLIMNELVSNAFKHAFPGSRTGEIAVSLKQNPDNHFRLEVSDDGVGLPETLNLLTPQSLGLRLVNIFVEQLEGTIRRLPGRGTHFEVVFPAENGAL